MSNQQAVEWLIDEMNNIKGSSISMNGSVQFIEKELNKLFEQAKAMVKEQIKNAYSTGYNDKATDNPDRETSKQYYNQTFKSE